MKFATRLYLTLFIPMSMFGQGNTGGQLQTVTINATANQSYVKYLPLDYNDSKQWPVVFIFDPGANGSRAIEFYKEVANSFGYLLIASNVTQNGNSWATNLDAASQMINHALDNLPINPNRMYVSGFSGGSRLASAIAVLTKRMQGVIACGAGFSPNQQEQPALEEFSFVGLVGDLDMNYTEMIMAQTWLDKFKVPNTLFFFKGIHQWPEGPAMNRAFTWLELEARRKGLKTIPKDRMQALFLNSRQFADSLLAAKNNIRAWQEYQFIKANYPVIYTKQIDSVLRSLQTNKALLKAVNEENNLVAKELVEINTLSERFLKELESPKSANLKWWNRKISKLKDSGTSPLEIAHSKRLLTHIRVIAYESGFVVKHTKSAYKKQLFSIQLCLAVAPENRFFNYQLIKTHVTYNQIDLALASLEAAFRNKSLLPNEFITYDLHGVLSSNKAYIELIKAYQSTD